MKMISGMNVPPIDEAALLAMGNKMLESGDVSDDVRVQMGAVMMAVAAANEAKEVAKRKRCDEKNARFYMREACSYYCAPLIDFVSEQFDNFVNLYYDSKSFGTDELRDALDVIWKILAEEHASFHRSASDKDFYDAYRMFCKDYLRQRYNKLVTRLTSVYRESGVKRCRLAAMISAMNAVATMSDTGRGEICKMIQDYYKTDVGIDEYSMVNVLKLFDHIVRTMRLTFLTRLKPKVDRYLEEFYLQIYLRDVISYGLDHTKERYPKETYDARLHAIDVFGEGVFG